MAEDRPGAGLLRGLGRYATQLVLVYPLAGILAVPLLLLLSKAGMDGNLGPGVLFAGFAAISCLFSGVLVGWIAGKKFPGLIRSGVWTWVLPTAILLFDVLPGSQIAHYGYVYATSDNEGLG